MNAEQIRAEAVSVLNEHQPFEDVYTYCTCGIRVADDGGYGQHVVDVLAAAGLLPTAVEVSSCFPDEPEADDEAMRRYVTDWREMSE